MLKIIGGAIAGILLMVGSWQLSMAEGSKHNSHPPYAQPIGLEDFETVLRQSADPCQGEACDRHIYRVSGRGYLYHQILRSESIIHQDSSSVSDQQLIEFIDTLVGSGFLMLADMYNGRDTIVQLPDRQFAFDRVIRMCDESSKLEVTIGETRKAVVFINDFAPQELLRVEQALLRLFEGW